MEPAPRLIHNIRSGGDAQGGGAPGRSSKQQRQEPVPAPPQAPPFDAAPANRVLRAARD